MKNKFLLSLIFVLSLFTLINLVQAAAITANVTETNINSTVLLTGTGFSPSTTYYLIPLLENKTAWWDGYNENWFFSTEKTNNTIYVTTDGGGEFTYELYIPNDWRVSGGKVSFKVGESLASALMWSKQGVAWPTLGIKDGITGDSDPDGFIYTVSRSTSTANTGGFEKFYKSNGTLACSYNWTGTTAIIPYDVTNNGSIAYAVTSATSNNLRRLNMETCDQIGQQTTAGAASYSVNVAPDNSYIIITYAASTAPRKYSITVDPPTQVGAFAPTAVASIAYDSCISPDGTIVYVGYANGNVTALNSTTGALIWDRSPPKEELNNANYAFPVYSLDCDNDKVYVGRGLVVYPAGITERGFIEALYATNGSRAWVNSKTDTIYDGQNVQEIRCKNGNYCYAVKTTTPAPYAGVLGSTIFQINKSNGNVTWWNWRSYLPTTYQGAYGSGGTHSVTAGLWVDPDDNGYIYPTYSNGWVQKIAKNDVNAERIETNLWIRGLTNFWNYIADVPKNIWLSNETPYYTFRHWNQQGMPLNTSATQLDNTFFRYSMLNTFNSFTAYEYTATNILGNSLFINPVIQTAPTQRNEIQYFNNEYHTLCPNTRYSPGLTGWHYQDRACHYEEIPATLANYNIGTTINGTYITGVVYSLIKTKFWQDYPITKYYGKEKWAWASWHNTANNQVLGFATKFGEDQEDVYSDVYGRAVLFANYGTTRYYRPQFRADLNRKTDNYIFFMPKTPDGNNTAFENTMWHRIDIETQKIANPVNLTLSADESGTFSISGNNYGNRINFTAQEPNLFNRTNEPVEIIFNATGGIRSDCQDVIITDETDTPISLWQVDNFTACSQNNNVSVWIMMTWAQNETKNLRLYYNSPSATPSASGTTDLVVTTASGSCAGNNHEVNINSSNWYYWQRPAAATASNEITRFNFNDSSTSLWQSTTHYQVAQCYKNSNTTGAGVGVATDTCGAAAAVVSRCLQAGGTGKIFAKLNATVAVGAVTGRPSARNTLNVEYYFFANTGRVRIRSQLAEARPIMNTTVSKNWPPYYYFSIANFIPPSGADSWVYYSGLYEQMKKPAATFNEDMTEANLSAGPLPLLFTIKYGGFSEIPQANGSILRPSTLNDEFWGTGCTAHKQWQYYNYLGGSSYGTSTAPLYTSEFISCSKLIADELPQMGEPGYVNIIPEMAWDGTTVNRWYDPSLIGKFYMMPNLYRPYNRENRFLGPYAISNPYTTARISSYIIPICPEKEYGYKGYDDFLTDLPNLIADTSNHIRENTENIPCASQIITRTSSQGADGIQIIFARNLTVIVGETASAGLTYPYNTFASGTYNYQADGELDLTFAQKASTTAGYYGKWYFTYTPYNYVMNIFATSGNPQFTSASPTSSYTIRYSWAPESYYNKNVWDETALWNRETQNFTYYRNPCWLGRYNNIYGSTEKGHAALTTLSTPGWNNPLFGGGYTCPRSTYNMETPDVFRPGYSSIYPTATGAGAWNELVVDGRMNFAGTGTPTEAGADTYYVARHNSLFDYKHNDDFNNVYENLNDLNQDEKHPNKQPWYCQISRHTNKSFCVMTNSMSSLIYNYNPGGGLTTSQPWSPYWSSIQEISNFKNYFVPRFFDTSAWLFPYDHSLDVTLHPTLGRDEVLTSNLLYVSDNADDYSLFFQKQFPTASYSQQQNQFLLKDWKNSAFMYLDLDSRQYAPGQAINITGLFIRNGEIFNNSNIVLQIYKNDGTHIKTYQTSTDAKGLFNWYYTLPTTLTSGLYYVYLDYNNEEFTDSVSFIITTYNVVTATDKLSYVQGEKVSITHTITDYIAETATDPVAIQEEIIDAFGATIKCSRYPSVTENCVNLLTKSATGSYSSSVILDESLPSGDATIKVTTTDSNGVDSYYYSGFGIGKTAGTITVSLQNTIIGDSFTSNVTTTNTGYETASKTAEVTVPTSCGYIGGVTNATGGNVSYNTQDLSSACKVYWTVTLSGKATTNFIVQATLQSSSGANPGIEIDAPSTINTNTNFGINSFIRNTNNQLTNCDGDALLTLEDNLNGSVILNSVSMTNSGTGRYNYTAYLSYQSTFLAEVTCVIGGTTYRSNPKIISSQNVPTNNTGGTGGSAYPTIELLSSTPIKTSTTASIGALVKSSNGIISNCDGSLGITIRNLADGTSSSGQMTNFGTGMYNYSWTTPATASVFYLNASCQISGTSYTGFTMLSTQDVGATATIDYNQIALYVWNYTSRNLTWYNQSVSESIQSCLKDGECSGWWINTTFTNIQNIINTINSTANQIKTNTETILSYLNCTSANEICTRLQNILNNATDIQSRVYSLNTSQIPSLQTGINNVYTDTQYIRTNMATASALANIQGDITWLVDNVATQTNISLITSKLDIINSTVNLIKTQTNCSNPSNSELCSYLDNMNTTLNSVYSDMATYSQVSELQSNITWIENNMVTQEMFNSNISEIRNRLTDMNTTMAETYSYLTTTIINNLNYINQTTTAIKDEARANNLSVQDKLDNLQSNVTWLVNNVATTNLINANFTEIFLRLTELNSTTQSIALSVNCSNPTNSLLCTYLNNINNTANSVYSEMATQEFLQQVALNVSYIRENMATYSQVADIGANVSWIKNNVATQEQISSNFSDVINRLTNMNSTLLEVHDDLINVNASLSNQIINVQNNITWLINNVATQEQISSNFSEAFLRLGGVNTTITDTNNYLYGTITNSLLEINSTNNNLKDYIHNQITNSLNEINSTTQDSYSYLINNLSIATNLTEVLAKLNGLSENLTYVKNNMFYQGNATGAFLVDYLATVYAEKNSRAELWILTGDLLGNEKTVSSASCSIIQKGVYIANATVSISPGSVYAYWDIPSNQTNGEYSWNCTLTGSTLNLNVPFFVSSATSNFAITSLVSASPKYPNENAIVEATFANQNGSVEPDSINLTIWKPNYLTIWHSANKDDFSVRNGVWYWTQMIEASPTTGTYYVNMKATYNNITDSKTAQFRIATGGPYKVYLECPTSSNVGSNLICTVIIQDEGEAATESTTTLWVDTNNNEALDAGEPQTSFSKETRPMQNITETATINVPSSHATGSFVVRASTEYLNSGQPNSAASDSVTLQTSGAGDTGGGSGGGSSGGGSGGGITGQTIIRPEHLMDVLVNTLEDYRIISSGPDNKVLFQVTFLNLGTEEIKDVVFTYCINKNNNNLVGDCKKETVAVQTKVQLVKKITLPSDLEEGTYTINVKINYQNKTAESSDTFEVKKKGESTTTQKQESFNLKINKSYLIIGVLGVASLIILIFIAILIIRRRNKHQKIKGIEYKLQHLKELKTKGEISERTYHAERERSLQRISGVLKGKTISVVLLGIGLISLLGILNLGGGIIRYVIGESVQNNLTTKYIYFILLIGAFGLFIFLHKQKVKLGVDKINEKIKKKYPANRIRGLINKKVYTDSGDYIGQIKDIILGENRIDSLKIKLDKKHKFKAKGIVMSYKNVKSIGHVAIVNNQVLSKIRSLKV